MTGGCVTLNSQHAQCVRVWGPGWGGLGWFLVFFYYDHYFYYKLSHPPSQSYLVLRAVLLLCLWSEIYVKSKNTLSLGTPLTLVAE